MGRASENMNKRGHYRTLDGFAQRSGCARISGGMIDARGTHHGGHLDLQRTVVGHEPMRVRVCLFDEVERVVSHDPETTYGLLQPMRTPLA